MPMTAEGGEGGGGGGEGEGMRAAAIRVILEPQNETKLVYKTCTSKCFVCSS